MNMSPGDIIVREAPLAGPVNRNNNKAAIGLGFDFPVDVLRDAPFEPVMGLGLFTDSDIDGEDTSSSSDDMLAMPSPPLLGVRRERRRPTPDSLWLEYAPMRTPSPSLRAWTAGMLYLAAPAAPFLALPSTPDPNASVGLGLDLPVLDDAELAVHAHSPAPAPTLVGLGLGMPGFDHYDGLIEVVPGLNSPAAPRAARMRTPARTHAPAHALVGLGLNMPSFDDYDDLIETIPGLNSPAAPRAARMHTPVHAGLGLGMPGFDDTRRITIDDGVQSASPVTAPAPAPASMPAPVRPRPRLVRALHQPSIDDDNVASPPSPSSPAPSGAYAAPVFHAARPERAQPRALPYTRATMGLGFCDEEGEPMVLEGASTIESPVSRRTFATITHSPPRASPLSGMDSPFWSTYASYVAEEENAVAEFRRSLRARLPMLEEIIYETPTSS